MILGYLSLWHCAFVLPFEKTAACYTSNEVRTCIALREMIQLSLTTVFLHVLLNNMIHQKCRQTVPLCIQHDKVLNLKIKVVLEVARWKNNIKPMLSWDFFFLFMCLWYFLNCWESVTSVAGPWVFWSPLKQDPALWDQWTAACLQSMSQTNLFIYLFIFKLFNVNALTKSRLRLWLTKLLVIESSITK